LSFFATFFTISVLDLQEHMRIRLNIVINRTGISIIKMVISFILKQLLFKKCLNLNSHVYFFVTIFTNLIMEYNLKFIKLFSRKN